ncbi:hypothetical protein H310_03436 [Aphanomyces invadans]|uniref:BZIP domain-containing protein n=1 Tax=Aphanomyces invadans TaxID=157072 RepID=A0A024UH33_9STRA|nr:hypothetical protein H310_03436 [Aphanomyces invadans]ETW05736.1 hypothetical protein H310_03436 [Aphanomyces invadans]|eukprot:XP_008865513.1 hypothetical protein H310_03436 [Aphanomyces invadans]
MRRGQSWRAWWAAGSLECPQDPHAVAGGATQLSILIWAHMIIPQPSAYEFPPFADDGDLLAFMDGTLFPPTKSSHDDMAVASCPSSPRSAHTTDLDTSDDCAHDHHFPMEKGERRKQQIRDASRRCRIKQRAEVMNLRTRVAELEARVATGIKLQRDHDMRLRQIELLEGEIARLRNELSESQHLLGTIRELLQ